MLNPYPPPSLPCSVCWHVASIVALATVWEWADLSTIDLIPSQYPNPPWTWVCVDREHSSTLAVGWWWKLSSLGMY